MDRQIQEPSKLQITVCPACGGKWFREATVHTYAADSSVLSPLSSDCEPARIGKMPMTVLICLCGTPLCMRPMGERGGTAKAELAQYSRTADCVKRHEDSRTTFSELEQEFVPRMVTKKGLQELRRAVAKLEKEIGRMLAHLNHERDKRGRHWRPPESIPTMKSKGRRWLTLQVQKCGLTFDESRHAVAAIFDAITDALKAGGSVATPIGRFRVQKRTKPYNRIRFGKQQRMHQKQRRVVFVPNPNFVVRSARTANEYERETEERVPAVH